MVVGGLVFDLVSAGGNPLTAHTCALTAQRAAYCWGSRDLGQVGDGS
jgi:hypothetical protein